MNILFLSPNKHPPYLYLQLTQTSSPQPTQTSSLQPTQTSSMQLTWTSSLQLIWTHEHPLCSSHEHPLCSPQKHPICSSHEHPICSSHEHPLCNPQNHPLCCSHEQPFCSSHEHSLGSAPTILSAAHMNIISAARLNIPSAVHMIQMLPLNQQPLKKLINRALFLQKLVWFCDSRSWFGGITCIDTHVGPLEKKDGMTFSFRSFVRVLQIISES